MTREHDATFLELSKERYNQLKGTADEFEVMQITRKYSGNKIKACQDANLHWLVQPADGLSPDASCEHDSNLFNFYEMYGFSSESCALIAICQDRRVVRRTIHPGLAAADWDSDFPFYAGGLKKEALLQLVYAFGLHKLHYNIYLHASGTLSLNILGCVSIGWYLYRIYVGKRI